MFEKSKILDFFEHVQALAGLTPYFEGESGDLLKKTSSYNDLFESDCTGT